MSAAEHPSSTRCEQHAWVWTWPIEEGSGSIGQCSLCGRLTAANRDAAVARTTLLAAADDFQINTWADVVLPAFKTSGLKPLAVTQAFIDWLRDRAEVTQ